MSSTRFRYVLSNETLLRHVSVDLCLYFWFPYFRLSTV